MNIGKKLKVLREEKGLSASECAKALSVSPSTYRDWEYGRSISGEPYLKIADLFDISLSELFGLLPSEIKSEVEEIERDLGSIKSRVKALKTFL